MLGNCLDVVQTGGQRPWWRCELPPSRAANKATIGRNNQDARQQSLVRKYKIGEQAGRNVGLRLQMKCNTPAGKGDCAITSANAVQAPIIPEQR